MVAGFVKDTPNRRQDEYDACSDEEVLLAVMQLARDIDDLTERADALGLGLPGVKLHEAAELCRREAPEPGTR